MKPNETFARLVPARGAAVACTTAIVLAASTAVAAAAPVSGSIQSTGHAMVLFAIVWLIASLRVAKCGSRWQLGFEPSPLKGLAGAHVAKDSKETVS